MSCERTYLARSAVQLSRLVLHFQHEVDGIQIPDLSGLLGRLSGSSAMGNVNVATGRASAGGSCRRRHSAELLIASAVVGHHPGGQRHPTAFHGRASAALGRSSGGSPGRGRWPVPPEASLGAGVRTQGGRGSVQSARSAGALWRLRRHLPLRGHRRGVEDQPERPEPAVDPGGGHRHRALGADALEGPATSSTTSSSTTTRRAILFTTRCTARIC